MAKIVQPISPETLRLRTQVIELKRRERLQDPLNGLRSKALEKYQDALASLVLEGWAVRGSAVDSGPIGTGGGSSSPNPVPAWANDLIDLEIRELTRRTEAIDEWIREPRPIKRRRGSKIRCTECGRGLAKGHKFCPFCGATAPPPKEEGEATR